MQRRKKAEGFDDFEEHIHGETQTHEEHSDSEDSYQPENHNKQTEEQEEEDDIEYVQTYDKNEVEKTDTKEEETDEKEEKTDGKNESGFRGRGKGRYNRGRGRGRGRGGRFQRQKGFEKKYKKITNNAEETQKSDVDKTEEDGDKKKVYNNYKKQRYDGQFNRGRGRGRGRGGKRLVKKYVPKTDDSNEDVQPTTENKKTQQHNQSSQRGYQKKVVRYSERRRREFKKTQDATNQTTETQNGIPQKGYQGMYVPPIQYDYCQYPQMYGQGQFIPVMGVVPPPVVYDTYGQQVYGNNQYYNPYQYPPYQMTNYPTYVKPKVLPPSESKLNVNAPIFNPRSLQTTETKQEKVNDEKKDSS